MRAIIFDLDDTLYRERRWVVSGFAAVARHLAVAKRLDRREVFRVLVGAVRAGRRHVALQQMCQRFDLPVELVPGLVALIRSHRPRLSLSQVTARVLGELRQTWRLGVLTNGPPAVQARKAQALGIQGRVDAVVYAGHYGIGKPDPRPFLAVAAQIGADPARCVFVGDDLRCDIQGARNVGMRTVRVRHPGPPAAGAELPEADAVVDHLVDVPPAATQVMSGESGDANDDLRACG